MRELDCMAVEAAVDEQKLERLLIENEYFILRCTSLTVHRYITKSDDEWSIALIAFAEAVRNYHFHEGSFLFFAKKVISRRLIDHMRSESKYSGEVPVNPAMFGTDGDSEDDANHAVRKAVVELSGQEDYSIRYEIQAINEIFKEYGFSFMDLSQCSPKSKKTKLICAKTVAYILCNPMIAREIKTKKLLPLKILATNLNVPRKKLEFYRKYIIAAVEILSGEYPYLAGYMHYIKEEIGK